MSGQGSLLANASRTVANNTLLDMGVAGNAFAPFAPKDGRLRQASVDPLNLYGGFNPKPAPEPPPPTVADNPVVPLPAIGDQQTEAARRQALEDQNTRRGRVSTILTSDSSDRLGS